MLSICCCWGALLQPTISYNPSIIRRDFFIQSFLASTIPQSASRIEEQSVQRIKPYAPLEQLLPAVRVKQRIDRALAIADADDSSVADELQELLFPPPGALLGTATVDSTAGNKPSQLYLDSYQRTREQAPLLAQPGAWLVQNGEIRAWKNLQSREQQQEIRDEARAAFNAYTNALSYNAESYLWTASPELKKQFIRQDRLPDVKAVVTADLDLRYLYRNQILTSWEDARAEWRYQTTQTPPDWKELLEILKQAQMACNRWFDFIDDKDIEEAMKVVDQEWKR
ncbi:hypothetical protein FisN_31Lh067 [Fistulifera solaris]|uniref:Uncharacterized protein n=1 Tax=Fistulifera solaris TaxID=1519565 RepID=A0A1Z5K6A4_FISSO|nr:hypothetical protein FisN_31Lh067 [Fistulifera solaris]|eukprot:GAX21777.1 hypothetical protein FisN_31Lh067 [Fistulifera solaris]